jgi:glutaredoxin
MFRNTVEIYGRPDCPWCDRAKELCRDAGYRFITYDITQEGQLERFQVRTRGARTVPQVFLGELLVGGFEGFKAAHDRGIVQQFLGGQ